MQVEVGVRRAREMEWVLEPFVHPGAAASLCLGRALERFDGSLARPPWRDVRAFRAMCS